VYYLHFHGSVFVFDTIRYQQGHPKAPSEMQNASRKSSGSGTKIRNLGETKFTFLF